MAKNLSIRFSASSSAASITQTTVPSDQTSSTQSEPGIRTDAGDESSTILVTGDEDSLNNEVEDVLVGHSICDINQSLEGQPVAGTEFTFLGPNSSVTKEDCVSKTKRNSITVGAKFVKQLQESLNSPNTIYSSSTKQETVATSWCKFAKSDDSLEIIDGSSQVESDDLHRETVSITLTPANASSQSVIKSSTSTTSTSSTSSSSSWLSEMKLYNSFRDKWRNEKKCSEDGNDCNPGEGAARKSTGSQSKPAGASHSSSTLPTSSQVTVSNPHLNNNYLVSQSRVPNTCGSCSASRGNQNNVPQQALATSQQLSPFYCACSRDADQTKCPTPQRTPTPPLQLLPSPVLYDPNSDPYFAAESSMIFPFRSSADGKDKKEKKEKELKESKKNKLFSSSHNSHSKEKDSGLRKKSKEPKEKEKDSINFMKIISTRSSSVSSSNSVLSPSANNNSSTSLSSFLSIISSSSTKNSSPTQSRSSSTENIDANSTDSGVSASLNATSLKNIAKGSKLPSSKSMISFRKLKNEEEAVLDDDFTSMMMHTSNVPPSQGNPTLRRKTDSFRRDSPTSDFNLGNEDGISMSSKSSSSSSAHLEQEPSLSHLDFCSSSAPTRQLPVRSVFTSLHSGVFSWATCFSYAYYIFALIVALVSLLISLVSPFPSFFNGFVLGFVCTFLLVTVVIIYAFSNYVFVKSPVEEHRSVTPESVSLKRSKSKKLSINGLNVESGAFSGWVYEFIGEYEEREKNGFASRLVFLVLYGTKLHVWTPFQDLNEKRLKQLMNESKMPNFASQRIIDFSKQNTKRITLFLTKNVRNQRKYIWSKKYPICLEFSDDRSFNGGGYMLNGKSDSPEPNSAVYERAKTPTSSGTILKMVLFARSCREKEEWFWAIKNSIDAANSSPKNSELSLVEPTLESLNVDFSNDSTGSDLANPSQQQYLRILTRRFNYHTFMRANVLSAEGIGPNSPGMMTPLTWFNILLNRLSFDILNKPNWSAYIAKKLQRKLRKLRLPYFMESLTITEIDIGTTLPKFNSVPSVPVVDDAGLWIDFDVNYSGGFTMTLETKLNLMKLKTRESPSSETVQMSLSSLNASESGFSVPVSPVESPLHSPGSNPKQQKHWRGYRYRASAATSTVGGGNDLNEDEFAVDSDSDLDSIVTSSEDEEPETAPADPDDADTDEKQKKVIRFVDKIASSQYFQKATQINFLRKAIEGFSKMSIMLTVQINSLSGTLAINIPESPSDRLWYGFRNEPSIQISARPKVGDHDLNLHYVTNFIEKKLRAEFFNYFVIPHMDDFFIPALNTNIEQYINVVS